MDQELIAYLNREFAGLRGEITELRGEVTGLRGEFEAFRNETNDRFGSLERRLDGVEGRLDGVEDQIHFTQITVESLRGDIQLLAEGVSAFDGKLENVRTELKGEIQEVKALLHQSYGDLNRRIS